MKQRITKVCEGCKATMFNIPDRDEARKEMLEGVKTRIGDLAVIMNHTESHKRNLLQEISKAVRVWLIKVRKLKGIYSTLNMFSLDATSNCFIAEGWIPTNDIDKISNALLKATVKNKHFKLQ